LLGDSLANLLMNHPVLTSDQSTIMKSKPRVFMLAAAVSLCMMFIFPLWKITLLAPQYPTGLAMFIWINKVTGSEPSTLQNINIMNHYIGMKPIEPDSIPELTYMQYIALALAGLALLLGVFNKWRLNLVWAILLVVAGSLAVYDFYLWEYDYGHNLSSDAAIKIEGMAYQPPLFGTKLILNFTAKSYPRLGAAFLGLSMVLGGMAVYFGRKARKVGQ
jgi:copper chaperone NosL